MLLIFLQQQPDGLNKTFRNRHILPKLSFPIIPNLLILSTDVEETHFHGPHLQQSARYVFLQIASRFPAACLLLHSVEYPSSFLFAFCIGWQFPEKTVSCAGMAGSTALLHFIKQCIFITVHQHFHNFLQMSRAFTFFPECVART